MKLFKEKAGIISPGTCWVFIDYPYLYIHENFFGLLWQIVTQWRRDQHLAGH